MKIVKLTQEEIKVNVVIRESNKFANYQMLKYISTDGLLKQLDSTKVAVDPDPQANCNNLDLELMALGIPVICLPYGGNPEICLPELVSSENGIVDKINYVLENQEFFSKRAREHVVENFKIEDCLAAYKKVFEEVLK